MMSSTGLDDDYSQIFCSTVLLNFLKYTPVLFHSWFCSSRGGKLLIFVKGQKLGSSTLPPW